MRWALLFVLLVGLAIGGVSFWVVRSVNQPTGTSTQLVFFKVTSGEGIRDIGRNLKQQELIPSATAWAWYMVLTGRRSDIQAGQYNLNRGQNGREIADALTQRPASQEEVAVTIIEGSTAATIAEQLEKAGVVSVKEFLEAVALTDSRDSIPGTYYEFLTDKPATATMEGFLFPDTYRFYKNTSGAAALQKFLDNFDTKLPADVRQAIKASGRTYYQTIIMASILEGELRGYADRRLAADLYWRRVDAGMALNADITVVYALGKERRLLTKADLEIDSPYNTYKHPGLPPGPIGNPGSSALKAAALPEKNDYWYYLSAPSGETIFSKTLEEHNGNVVKYLR